MDQLARAATEHVPRWLDDTPSPLCVLLLFVIVVGYIAVEWRRAGRKKD